MDRSSQGARLGGLRTAADHEQDIELVRAILGGSTASWHEFVGRYSRLIQSVIHRYVPRSRGDDVQTLHASVLETLYRTRLARYEGRATLSTWVVLVTRSVVVDHLRRQLGGRELHAAIQALPRLDREVFRRYYVEGMSFRDLRASVRDGDAPISLDRLLESLHRIEERVKGRLARRLRYDLYAQSVGAVSGRLLEYLDHVRYESEQRTESQSAEHELTDREARRTLERVAAELARLPAKERQLLTLRFERGWTAEQIAEGLGLPGQRRVYTWIDRVMRSLRRTLLRGADSEPGRRVPLRTPEPGDNVGGS